VSATTWDYEDDILCVAELKADVVAGVVGWVPHLIVGRGARRRLIATHLSQTFKTHPLFKRVTSVGLVSPHLAAGTHCPTLPVSLRVQS